jgi:DNA-directed RNA polymerase specialized sigma subunit
LANDSRLSALSNSGLSLKTDLFSIGRIALRTAVENGEGVLDKEATSHDDLMDAFITSLMFWH